MCNVLRSVVVLVFSLHWVLAVRDHHIDCEEDMVVSTPKDMDHTASFGSIAGLIDFMAHPHLREASAAWGSFVQSVMIVCASGLGDKSFFVVAIMATRHNAGLVYTGAMTALALMTMVGATIALVLPHLVPPQFIHWFVCLNFALFAVHLLWKAWALHQSSDAQEFSEERTDAAEALLWRSDEEDMSSQGGRQSHLGSGSVQKSAERLRGLDAALAIVVQTFLLTFAAEWGDRTQMATVALASDQGTFSVMFGVLMGQALCTLVACAGGSFFASYTSERCILLTGGLISLGIALCMLILPPSKRF